jgi:hypothetical protein
MRTGRGEGGWWRSRPGCACDLLRDVAVTVLDDLVQLGFGPVTHWVLKGEKIGPASFDWRDHGGWLYAFVVEGEVKYIGLTDRVLRSRMSDYAHIKNSQTDRLRGLIMGELKAGRVVHVFGWKQQEVNILKVEEARLRTAYKPPWNRV